MKSATATVPYEEIDVELRRLVHLLNQFEGIETIASCAGHEPGQPSEVQFTAATQTAFANLLRALPVFGQRSALVAGRPEWSALSLHVERDDTRWWYTLQIAGAPVHARRDCLSEVEAALSGARGGSRPRLAAPQPERPKPIQQRTPAWIIGNRV